MFETRNDQAYNTKVVQNKNTKGTDLNIKIDFMSWLKCYKLCCFNIPHLFLFALNFEINLCSSLKTKQIFCLQEQEISASPPTR